MPPSSIAASAWFRHRIIPALLFICMPLYAQQPANPVLIDGDGTVHMPAQVVPPSSFLSPEGKAYLAEHLHGVQNPAMLVQDTGIPPLLAGYLKRQRELFKVNKQDTRIAGVHAYVYEPAAGISGNGSACCTIWTVTILITGRAFPAARDISAWG